MRSASLEASVRVPGMTGAGFWDEKYGEEIICDGTRHTVGLHLVRPVEMPFTPSAKHVTADVQLNVLGCIHCAYDPFYRGAHEVGAVKMNFVGW